MQKKKTNKKKLKRRRQAINYALLVCIVLLAIYITYEVARLIIAPTDVVMIEEGIVTAEESAVGYIIREETLIKKTDNNSEIIPIKIEGEKAAKGDKIFRYYNSKEEELKKQIEELNNKIQEEIEKEEGFFSGDIKSLDNQIEEKLENLRGKNNLKDIDEYKKDIDKYIAKKVTIIGELKETGTNIKKIISQKEKLQNEIEKGSEYVKTAKSGVVSYRIDSLEEVLNIKTIDKKTLEELDLKTGQMITSSNSQGKIVNNFECYIATFTKAKEAKEAKIGDKVKLRLSTQNEVNAIIQSKKEEDGTVLIVFKIINDVERLIPYRKISLDIIWWERSGLKVPNDAIIYDNGLSYVERNRAGYVDRVLIKVLKESTNYSIVGNYDAKELKELGFGVEEINSMRRISIYDEIVLKPDLK